MKYQSLKFLKKFCECLLWVRLQVLLTRHWQLANKTNKLSVNFSRILRLSSDGSGPKPFWRALGPTLGEWLKPGPGPGPWLKAWGLKARAQRALEIQLSSKKLALLWKILSQNLKLQLQIIFFCCIFIIPGSWLVLDVPSLHPIVFFLSATTIRGIEINLVWDCFHNSLCINVNLPEFCLKLIFFKVN